MIPWGWLIAAFFAGMFVMLFILGLCRAAKDEPVNPYLLHGEELERAEKARNRS